MPIVHSASGRACSTEERAGMKGASPMERAFIAARQAARRGEVPVGAAVADAAGRVIAVEGNRMRESQDACAHAELLALRLALRHAPPYSSPGRLDGCDLWVTLEPCAMCAAAAGTLRVRRIVFAAYDPKGGGIEHGARIYASAACAHRPEIVGGMREEESRNMLRDFFRDLRAGFPGEEARR